MGNESFKMRANLINVYDAFAESLREAFLIVITSRNAGKTFLHSSKFKTLADARLERFYDLLDVITASASENVSQDKLESFSKTIKRYMFEDVQSMNRLMHVYELNVRARQIQQGSSFTNAVIAERESVFKPNSQYRLETLGKLTNHLL